MHLNNIIQTGMVTLKNIYVCVHMHVCVHEITMKKEALNLEETFEGIWER